MKILLVGSDWITQYLVGDILIKDQDHEDEIVVVDPIMKPEDFFHFPPISKYAGDERLNFTEGPPLDNFDVIIHNSNFIEEAGRIFQRLSDMNYKGRVIVMSTWEIYGFQGRRQIPFDEFETKPQATTPLGQTKEEIEKIALGYENLNVVVFRLSTIFGPYMPEDSELLRWMHSLLTQETIVVEQPAARALDLCYVTNVLAPIQKAFTADLPHHIVVNLGSADVDWKAVRERGKDVPKVQVFEKNIVEVLVGLRHLLDSHSKIEISEADPQYLGKGFHSQLKTATARKLLDYLPLVDTMKGCLQTALWLQKRMELDGEAAGRAIDDIYPTLKEEHHVKVGETIHEREVEYEKRKELEKESKQTRKQLDIGFICPECNHSPLTMNPSKTNPNALDERCHCECHAPYREIEP